MWVDRLHLGPRLTCHVEEKYPEVDSFVMVNVKQVGTPNGSRQRDCVAERLSLTMPFSPRSPIWVHTSSSWNTTTCLFRLPAVALPASPTNTL
jgi:hypothetical protein